MNEPAILGFGRVRIKDYDQSMFEACFARLFEINRQEEVSLTSNINGQDFMAAAVAWGVDSGLLFNFNNDTQKRESVHYFRLTEAGEKRFLSGHKTREKFPVTRAEIDLKHLGVTCFSREELAVTLSYGLLKFRFECDCPYYPIAMSQNCPIHHEGVRSYGPITEADELISEAQEARNPSVY